MHPHNDVKWRVWRGMVAEGIIPRLELQKLPSDEDLRRIIQNLKVPTDVFWRVIEGLGPKSQKTVSQSLEERVARLEAVVLKENP